MRKCSHCGEDNAETALFCQACGRPLATDAPPHEMRKTVTVLFADVTGSTAIGERLDPESLRRMMSRYFREMRLILESHGGTVEKFIGDAVMAVFGVPVLHEDDALRAVRAAAEMRTALESLNEELDRLYGVRLQTRTGLNTGEVIAGDPAAAGTTVMGDAVNVAARLEQSARPGEILMGEDTHRLVRDAVVAEQTEPLSLKGKTELVRSFRLLEVRPGADGVARDLQSPMVGRVAELAALWEIYEQAAQAQACHLFTVLGTAGVGKSRLANEFLSGLGEQVTALSGRCLPYGEGITFWPIGEVVREACGLEREADPERARARLTDLLRGEEHADRIAEGVAQMIGLAGASGTPEETFWGIRRFLEVMARPRPLVVVLDDVHWGAPTFLDLVDYLLDFAEGPLLFLCLARSELLDLRPSWGAAKQRATTIALEPLNDAESGLLMESLLGRAGLDEKARTQITDASEGNPLFIEEMLRMLIDEGFLEPTNGHWTPVHDLSNLSVPPTISALLGARLERLDQEERAVAQRASVVGKVFYWGAVAALTPGGSRPDVGRHLQSLVRKELIAPDPSAFAGEDAFRFRHLLIRDAAYRAIPKETRADLHERFAEWLAGKAGDRATEYEEILGHHLEQAYRYRADLGPVDERGEALAVKAGDRLASSGRRAFDRGDVPAAINLLPRAAALLPMKDPRRLVALTDLGQAFMEHGELTRADEVLAEAIEAASVAEERGAEAHARLARLRVQLYTDPEGKTRAIRQDVERVMPIFEGLGDERGLARAAYLLVEIDWMAGRYAEVEGDVDETITHARRAGDRRQEMEALGRLAAAVLYGPTPVDEGIRRCREIQDRSGGDLRVQAVVLSVEAQLRAMSGRFKGTREQIAKARTILRDLGLTFLSTAPSGALGFVEMLADDSAAAERELRWGYEALEGMGERGLLSTAAAELAQAVYAQGRYQEAERLALISQEAAASDDIASHVPAGGVRAKVLARQGKREEAERLAGEAAEMARGTDNLNMRGDALMDLAEVLRLAGRPDEAEAALDEAAESYERKGNVVSAQKVGALRAELSAGRAESEGSV